MWANHRTGGRGGAKGHAGVAVSVLVSVKHVWGGASERALNGGVFLFVGPQSMTPPLILSLNLPLFCCHILWLPCVSLTSDGIMTPAYMAHRGLISVAVIDRMLRHPGHRGRCYSSGEQGLSVLLLPLALVQISFSQVSY